MERIVNHLKNKWSAPVIATFIVAVMMFVAAKNQHGQRSIPAGQYDQFRQQVGKMSSDEIRDMHRALELKLMNGHFIERFNKGILSSDEASEFSWLTYEIGLLKIKLIELDLES